MTMPSVEKEAFHFEGYTLDLIRGCLGNASGEIELRPKSFELLRYLVENAGRLISKDELINAVWPNVIVSDDSLAQCVSDLRHALNDPDRRIIKTAPRRGYLFAAPFSMSPDGIAMPLPKMALSLPDDLSVAVRPFENPTDDPSRHSQTMTSTSSFAVMLAADVVGYSRLIGADEGSTLRALKAIRTELFDPAIAACSGRLVKATGDGLLVEFNSVVDALHCATQLQKRMAERNESLPAAKRIEFRIGIHQGEVVVEGSDIRGDGVNVATRLETLTEPGGICVSGVVRDQIHDKLPYLFQDGGEQSIKNIPRPVRVYALRPAVVADLSTVGMPIAATRRRRTILAAIAAATAMLFIAVIAWLLWPTTRSSSTSSAAVTANATSISQPFVAPRLSIVVLPFANLSSDPEQQYFADGVTDDLTTDLSRNAHLLVISRNTAFTYRSKPVDAKQIGRELGVRYVLEGSVRRSGNQVRVNAQLINAETAAHLWAERFDREMGELFALQNEITSRIAVALNIRLVATEATRPTEHPEALDYILRGRAALNIGVTSNNLTQAADLFEHALALDPQSAEVQSLLALTLTSRVLARMTNSRAADIRRAGALVEQALGASPRSALAHYAKGQLLRAEERCEEAIPEYEVVIASNPNSAPALFSLGVCKMLTGAIEEAIPMEEQAIRLSPRDPAIFSGYIAIGQVHLLQSRTADAIVWFEKARNDNPRSPYPHAWLASAYALKGNLDRADVELADARRLVGGKGYSSIAVMRASGYWGVPSIRALHEATFFAGLRKAGVPEE
jgi:TolB-like protein/class 3 adenylate cyclase/DNA-binding winged helix-turn-helix (wHTH) protein